MGGGQLLGNDDDVMVPPGSGLPPVGNSCKWLVASDYNVQYIIIITPK